MNEEENPTCSHYKCDEFSSDEGTYKINVDNNRRSCKKSNCSPFVTKRVSDNGLKHRDLSYVKHMSYSYKKLNAKLKNREKENEVFHRQQRRIQLALPAEEFDSSRFHSAQRIHDGHTIQSSIIFNNQEIPSTNFSDNRADPSTHFFDNCTSPSTSFFDNTGFLSTSFSDNHADPSTSFSSNRSISSTSFFDSRTLSRTSFSSSRASPNSSFSDNLAFLKTSFSGNYSFPNASFYDDQVVPSKTFSDDQAIQSTSFSSGKVTSRVSFKKNYSLREEVFAPKVSTDLDDLFESLELETSSDKDSTEVNLSDSSDYESMSEIFPPNFPECKEPAKESNTPVSKHKEKRKKRREETLESPSNIESLFPIQKFHGMGNFQTVVTQTGKNREVLTNEDQANRKRHISENECHSLGVFDITCGFKKLKPL